MSRSFFSAWLIAGWLNDTMSAARLSVSELRIACRL